MSGGRDGRDERGEPGRIRVPRPGRDAHPQPAGKAQRLQRRVGAASGGCAAPLRPRPRGRGGGPVRARPRLFERRRRASAPAAQTRGIRGAGRAAGLGRQFRRAVHAVGQLEAGHRGAARLCHRSRPRHRARKRSDRRRSRHQISGHRDLARPRRREILGVAALSRCVCLCRRGRADRAFLHRRRSPGGRHRQSRGAGGRASRGGARAGRRHREKPAAVGAGDGADAALVHGPARTRGGDADGAAEALSLRRFRRSRPCLC